MRIPDHELEFQFSRSSGPGGQNVNKVNSRVTLRWQVYESKSINDDVRARFVKKFANIINDEGEVVIHSDKFRDQPRNIEDTKEKLAALVESVRVPPKKRVPTRPKTSAKMERLSGKKIRGERKKFRMKMTDY